MTRKTAQLVQQHTQSSRIKESLEVYEINEQTLHLIEAGQKSDTEKVHEMLKSLEAAIECERLSRPYLRSIGEKADLISTQYKQRQANTQEILDSLKSLIKDMTQAQQEYAAKKMSADVFAAYWMLKTDLIPDAEAAARAMAPIFETYPYWRGSTEQQRRMKQELLKNLLQSGLSARKSNALVKNILQVLKESADV